MKLTPEEKKVYIEMHSQQQEDNQPWLYFGIPENLGRYWPAVFGLPVETHPRPIKHPEMIWLLILSFVLVEVFVATKIPPEHFFNNFGFTPQKFYLGFYTLFTSFFIHSGWAHLLGNAYYFYHFGDDVEDDLGPLKFLGLLFGSHIFGILVQSFLTLFVAYDIPIGGASAGVSGIMGYYMVRFPMRRLTIMPVIFIWAHVPVFFILVWKYFWEFVVASSGMGGNVAHWAHLGGAAYGFIYACVVHHSDKRS